MVQQVLIHTLLLAFFITGSVVVSGLLVKLDDYVDENGCHLGEEFTGNSCEQCPSGTYRFFSPISNENATDPFLCIDKGIFHEIDLTLTNLTSFEISHTKVSGMQSTTQRCTKCKSGFYNPYKGAKSAHLCLPCPRGMTSSEGASECVDYKSITDNLDDNDTPASFSSSSSTCPSCGAGSYLVPCGSKQKRSLIENPFCCNDGSTDTCRQCQQGSYSTKPNSLTCEPCPPGYSTKTRGATSIKECVKCGTDGVKCSCRQTYERAQAVRSYRPVGNAKCIACPSGTRALTPYATSVDECIPCPDGHAMVYGKGCVECTRGTFTFGEGAVGCRETKEVECPEENQFKASDDGVCTTCPRGFRYDRHLKRCDLCPSGSGSAGFAQGDCTKCMFPEVASDDRKGVCRCASNHYRDYKKRQCIKCPYGTKINRMFHYRDVCDLDCENVPNQPGCIPCEKDHERISPREGCRKCPHGYKSRNEEKCFDPTTGCEHGTSLWMIDSGPSVGAVMCRKDSEST